ncbi:MAG TPA: hypothetical protein VHK06_07345, partial [Candidatus Limnocylindria bacterium]|nr:hypothetical protein [Candidatus Limnocylindria bacterium]
MLEVGMPAHGRGRTVRRAAAALLAGAVLLASVVPARAAEPDRAAAAAHLASSEGGAPGDFELLTEATVAV